MNSYMLKLKTILPKKDRDSHKKRERTQKGKWMKDGTHGILGRLSLHLQQLRQRGLDSLVMIFFQSNYHPVRMYPPTPDRRTP